MPNKARTERETNSFMYISQDRFNEAITERKKKFIYIYKPK